MGVFDLLKFGGEKSPSPSVAYRGLNEKQLAKTLLQQGEYQQILRDFLDPEKSNGIVVTFLQKNSTVINSLRNLTKGLKCAENSIIRVSEENELINVLLKNAKGKNRPVLFFVEHNVQDKDVTKVGLGLVDSIKKIKFKNDAGEEVLLDTVINIIYLTYNLDEETILSLGEIGVNQVLFFPILEEKLLESIAFAIKLEIRKEFDDLHDKIRESIESKDYRRAIFLCNQYLEKKPNSSDPRMFLGEIYLKLFDESNQPSFCHTKEDLIKFGIIKNIYNKINILKNFLLERGIDLKTFLQKHGYCSEDLDKIQDFRLGHIFKILNKIGFSNSLLKFVRFSDEYLAGLRDYYLVVSEQYYKESVEKNPNYIKTRKELEKYYLKIRNKKKRLKILGNLHTLSPLIVSRNTLYIKALIEDGDVEKATEVLNYVTAKVLKHYNKISTKKYLLVIARQFLKFGKLTEDKTAKILFLEKGIFFLEKALKLQGKGLDDIDFQILELLGNNYKIVGNLSESINCYKKMLQKNPDDINIYLNIALVYFYEYKIKDAIKWADAAYKKEITLDVVDNNPECIYLISCLYYRGKRKDDTVLLLEKVIEVLEKKIMSNPDEDKTKNASGKKISSKFDGKKIKNLLEKIKKDLDLMIILDPSEEKLKSILSQTEDLLSLDIK